MVTVAQPRTKLLIPLLFKRSSIPVHPVFTKPYLFVFTKYDIARLTCTSS